ncbi:DUF6502 family protein [Propionivibrio sp.]|uniref:DUF6502 family protein n=1 Tax=Propionivibrio sp. TaxID=2212460 RepID=UPI003BF29781
MNDRQPLSQTPDPPSSSIVHGSSPALVRAMRLILQPLVRLMLARGITYPYLAELLKGLFVEVADKDFRLNDKPATDSRISLLSGVHRKDVSRLRTVLKTEGDVSPSVVSFGSQLVSRWLGAAQYLDENGKSKSLARLASEGGEHSFEALVASVSKDIRSRVVLDEWLRLGVVHLDDENRVCLNAEAFVPTKGFDEKNFYFGHNLHDHASAAAHNLLCEPQAGAERFVPFMERSVHCAELSPDSVHCLAKQCEDLGMHALLAANKLALEAEANEQTESTDQPRQRMTFGIYFYAEPVAHSGDAS